ncbi:MAG: exodeoxyribonuclease VII large subunit [Acidimicrobiales bacterium]
MTLFDAVEGAVPRLSLVRLSAAIARSLGSLGRVAVEGEVVMARNHPGGTYFTLRDRAVQIPVRCPAASSARCRVVAGERVLVTGALVWLTDRGQAQFVAEEVAPVGAGAISAAIAERRAALAADGLLDRRRRPLPRLPAVIGVVCGTEAAVRADIESVVAARFPGYPVDFVSTNVSGPGAADAVMAAVAGLDARPEIEVIMLARGGGDAAQLLPFSDEALCRALCALATPVVSAIGHDGDRPLCDEVADHRFGTPSLAAAAVVPSRAELVAELFDLAEHARRSVVSRCSVSAGRLAVIDRDASLRTGVTGARARLTMAAARHRLVHPARAVGRAGARLAQVPWRGPLAARAGQESARLSADRRHLEALAPARVLDRGYAVVRTAGGSVVRRADALAVGDGLDVQLAVGRLGVTVATVEGAQR